MLSEDLGGGRRERIAPGAFAGVVGGDVRALLNHDPNEVLGRTKSGTSRLFDEQRGLRFELDLPDSPLGENCARLSAAATSTAPRSSSRLATSPGKAMSAQSRP